MTSEEKKLLQAKHRLEEAQARDRVKERKARTRRLIQEGAVLEKVLPEVQAVGLDNLEEYLRRKLQDTIENGWEVSGKPGASSFPPVRAHLLTTLKGSGISCGNRALCEADAAAAAASRQCHSTCRVLLSSSAQVAVVSALETACTLPAQTCHRQLCLRLCPKLIFGAFSLLRKRNRKRKNEVKKIWRFIIWKRRWSAGAQAAPQ